MWFVENISKYEKTKWNNDAFIDSDELKAYLSIPNKKTELRKSVSVLKNSPKKDELKSAAIWLLNNCNIWDNYDGRDALVTAYLTLIHAIDTWKPLNFNKTKTQHYTTAEYCATLSWGWNSTPEKVVKAIEEQVPKDKSSPKEEPKKKIEFVVKKPTQIEKTPPKIDEFVVDDKKPIEPPKPKETQKAPQPKIESPKTEIKKEIKEPAKQKEESVKNKDPKKPTQEPVKVPEKPKEVQKETPKALNEAQKTSISYSLWSLNNWVDKDDRVTISKQWNIVISKLLSPLSAEELKTIFSWNWSTFDLGKFNAIVGVKVNEVKAKYKSESKEYQRLQKIWREQGNMTSLD